MYDVIIIGMGIAGITAGIYAKRAGHSVLMFEKNVPGGMLMQIDKIKNYPGFDEISGSDLAMNLFNQVRKLDIEFKMEEVTSVKLDTNEKSVVTKSGTYTAKNIIFATGRTPKFIGLDNEKDYLGRGLSTCATCDGALYKNQDVVVVGGGNSALQESLYLADLCNMVYIIHRDLTFKAEEKLVNSINEKENIKVLHGVNITKINETEGKISSVDLDNGTNIEAKGVFIYIGFKPDTDLVKDYDLTNLNGDIIVNDEKKTSIDNVYAIGDCIKKGVYQLVTAASDGAIAINDIDKIK